MAERAELIALRDRVRAAKGLDRALWCEIVVALLYRGPSTDDIRIKLGTVIVDCPDLQVAAGADDGIKSIDAALALVERALPGAYVEIGVNASKDDRRIGTAFIHRDCVDLGACWDAATAPLAILDALLTVLLTTEPTDA